MFNVFTRFSLIGPLIWTVSSRLALAQSQCTLNGKDVPCEEIAVGKGLLGGWGPTLVFFIIFVASTMFWLTMLIHVATKPIKNKAVWVVIMAFTGTIGALVYYFMVKRKSGRKSR